MKSFAHRCALASVLSVPFAIALAPTPVHACGGTFCDAGPQQMPVDQSGENILFILDGDTVEVHIQIRYEGDPEKFAWVIPLSAVPEFAVGSETLFQNLLTGTVPTYGFTTTRDQCDLPGANGLPTAQDEAAGFGDGGLTGAESDGGGGGPEVVLREVVGAYEIAVLQGGTAAEVVQWLDENGYQQDPEAEPILEEYLAEGLMFGAIKLTGGAGVDEIHPVALRYQGNEPCVPLRLTRIAAVEDMEVRTFFLGDHRMVPTNYRHVLVNPLMIDWLNLASNYIEVITAAVDAQHANGRAFVTEYAGPSDAVPQGGLYDELWNTNAFASATAQTLSGVLQEQNLVFCADWMEEGCQVSHPLLEGLLGESLSLPEGVPLGEFLLYPEQFPMAAFDSESFVQAFRERVEQPGLHARELLQRWGYVTRMYTTISPHEMTADPIFHERRDLADVPNIRQGEQRIRCDGNIVFTLPDEREVYIPAGGDWPTFPNEMPWEEEVQEVPQTGATVTLANNTAAIDSLLAQYNTSVGFGQNGCNGCKIEREPSRTPFVLASGVLLLGVGSVLRRRRRRRRRS